MDKPRFPPAGFWQNAIAEDRQRQQDRPTSRFSSPSAARTPSPVFDSIDFSSASPLLDDSPDNVHHFIDAMMALDYPSPTNRPALSGANSPLPFALKDIPVELFRLDVDDVDEFFAGTPGPTTPGRQVVMQAAALLRQQGQWNFPHADTLFGLAFGRPLAGHFNMRFEVERQGEAGAPGFRLQFGEPQAAYAGRLVLRNDHYGVETGGRFHDMPADGDCAFHAMHVLSLQRQGYKLRGYIGQTRPDGTIALRVAPGDHTVGDAITQLRALAADYVTHRADEIGAWLDHPTSPTDTLGMRPPDQPTIDNDPIDHVPAGPVDATRKRSGQTTPYSSASPCPSGSAIAMNSLRQAPKTPTLIFQGHANLMKALPEGLGPTYRSAISQLLAHLEDRGQSWSQLVPAGSGPGIRPPALEKAVNEGIRLHRVHPGTRSALNKAFGFTLQGESRPITFPLALQAHLNLMKALPKELNLSYRSFINRLLAYLEEQDQSWSRLVPTDSGPGARPPDLEKAINEGIERHDLQPGTRAAVNKAFGFTLRGKSGIVHLVPFLQVHTDLMKTLPEALGSPYRSCINRLLVHLEEQGQSWSELVPAGSGPGACPPELEEAVRQGIWHHALHPSTRAAINQAFGFAPQRESRPITLPPARQAHLDLLKTLPDELGQPLHSHINRLLVYLEDERLSWSQLVPTGSGVRPPALEQVVNEGIRRHELHPSTRSAINQAFGFALRPASGIVRLAPALQAHLELMKTLPDGLSQPYRSHINRLLSHLEEQSQSWSHLVPVGSCTRPPALEQVVNEGIRRHELHPSTWSAVNQAFGFTLRTRTGVTASDSPRSSRLSENFARQGATHLAIRGSRQAKRRTRTEPEEHLLVIRGMIEVDPVRRIDLQLS